MIDFSEPIEDLKYLNIDYTQFNGWSSDEEVTIFTGIEKGYETWLLNGPDNEGAVSSFTVASIFGKVGSWFIHNGAPRSQH